MFSSTSLLFRILAFEIHDRPQASNGTNAAYAAATNAAFVAWGTVTAAALDMANAANQANGAAVLASGNALNNMDDQFNAIGNQLAQADIDVGDERGQENAQKTAEVSARPNAWNTAAIVSVENQGGNISWYSIGANFVEGAALAAITTGLVIIITPVVITGLVAVGIPTTIAVGAVTLGVATIGVIGGATTLVDTFQHIAAGEWNAVAYNAGTILGGVAVSASGGGRWMAERMMGRTSNAPNTWNLRRILSDDRSKVFNPSGELSLFSWEFWATAPTPTSGGVAAALSVGITHIFEALSE